MLTHIVGRRKISGLWLKDPGLLLLYECSVIKLSFLWVPKVLVTKNNISTEVKNFQQGCVLSLPSFKLVF